jgi:methionine synthase I (cobalamin-dependent)
LHREARMMNRDMFKQRLESGPLLLDGAMGTLLYGKGAPIDQCLDALNRREPQAVAGIHRDYIDAGVDVLETNTFTSNRFKLAE